MRWTRPGTPGLLLTVFALSVLGCSPARTATQGDPSSAAQDPASAFVEPSVAGVTTHFSQGWPPRLMADAHTLGSVMIRDSVHWARVETVPGTYTFNEANSGHLSRACSLGMTVLLGVDPRNPRYDGGQTAHSAAAQRAFALYLRAIADRWAGCVTAFEIGNEINAARQMTGPAAAHRADAHVALLRAVHGAVKSAHPDVVLLGGSTTAIGTGFLSQLFAAGLLQWVDGLAVHPYRANPEAVDWELDRLYAAMAAAGRVVPIWATEFSREFPQPADAPDFYLKMISLLESRGVTRHFWYALADQRFFPTMGLERLDGTRKPAGEAFAFATRTLAPLGRAHRVDHGDPTLFDFRFGSDTHVIWGGTRPVAIADGARAFSATGVPVPVPTAVSDIPLVIRGAPDLAFGAPEVLADSLYGYGRPPLAWFARQPRGVLVPLAGVDWQWGSYIGLPGRPALAVTPSGIGATRDLATAVRYTAPVAGAAVASFCLLPVGLASATVALQQNGETRWQGLAGGQTLEGAVPITLRGADHIDLVVSAAPGTAAARFRYRFRVSRSVRGAIDCASANIRGEGEIARPDQAKP